MIVTERERERGRDTGRGRSRLLAGSPMWDLIPGPQDHTLSWKQMLNHRATQVSQILFLIIDFIHKRHKQRERQTSCREPDGGLDPWTLESWPEPKADAQPLSHPGILAFVVLSKHFVWFYFLSLFFFFFWLFSGCARIWNIHLQLI